MFYTHDTLNRADYLRSDTAAIAALRVHSSTRLLPIWRGQVLVHTSPDSSDPTMLSLHSQAVVPATESIFLGLINEAAYFAVACSHFNEQARDDLIEQATEMKSAQEPVQFVDLRVIGPQVAGNIGALLAYARGMVYWHENSQFCSRCGQPAVSTHGGHIKHCSNEVCNHQLFPRTDPAVIMLVTHQSADSTAPRCLLGRSPAWNKGVYSTLAGFVEPGESLEQAVQREVLEEVGIATTDVQYISSQPWPFPRSIMLGFRARATSIDIQCDPKEIADARWFTREQLGNFGTWGDDRFELQLPRPDSIARYLINQWMANAD